MIKICQRSFSGSSRHLFLKKLQQHVNNTAPKEHVVKELLKPVGLDVAPRASTRYREGNSFKDMFNDAKTSERARELEVEFSRGGFYDVYTFRKTKGKLFLSPASYWRQDKALYFPHIQGRSLADSKTQNVEDSLRGKVSVVRAFTSEVGETLGRSYFEHDGKNYLQCEDGFRGAQIVEVNLTENFLKSLIVKLSLASLRQYVPGERHDRYFICRRDQLPFETRDKLQMNNLFTSYIFVVDPDLKIRWMACGGADDKDRELFSNCVKGVVKECSKP
ncbi:LAMI_0A02388g1_1 [Lachancea mirantina]|uniref:LAMI_0A02388g1_1 n=1 Tax=Lachancea mirantina TaxID=1230905 RepID=A0A1G4IME5_9SACH|nr:LAMI_0A02388g1_1 [Lachancea mirantina]